MQPSHEWAPRGRSGFAAAFLSLLFPGLGHVYLGAYRRGLGFAAPPFLLGALVAGFAVRLDTVDLAGLIVQSWFLTGLFVVNLVALAYRAVAIVDAWSIARRLGGPSLAAMSGPSLGPASVVSIAGLAAVLLVMALAHVAVARYDLIAAGTLDCVFNADTAGCRPGQSGAPNASGQESVGPAVSAGTVPPWDGKERLNILLIGADEQGGGHNTDTLITVSIDPATKQVVMFTLPRDTVDVPIPPGPARNAFGPVYPGKINQWFSTVRIHPDWYPGTDNTRGYAGLKAIMGELYQLDIRYYVEVNFDGFEKVVDALGGVTVNVQIPVLDDHYPSPDGLERLYIAAGMQHMNGAQALAYARSRHTSSDFDRGARQQRVLVSLRRQTDIARVLPSLDALTAALKESIRTDIPRELVPQLLGLAQEVDTRSIRSVIFTPPFYQTECLNCPPRGYIITPRVARIRAAVQEAFRVDAGFAEARDAVAAEGAAAWVLNGSGRTGEAATLAAYLEYFGIAASAPTQRPDVSGLQVTTIRAYNGAETKFPLTMAALSQILGVQVVPVTDPAIRVDFVVITGRATPQLTPPPVP